MCVLTCTKGIFYVEFLLGKSHGPQDCAQLTPFRISQSSTGNLKSCPTASGHWQPCHLAVRLGWRHVDAVGGLNAMGLVPSYSISREAGPAGRQFALIGIPPLARGR